MKQYLYTFSLIACAVSVTLPTPALGVTLYGAGSLRSSLTELAKAFTTNSGIAVNTYFGPSGLTRAKIEDELLGNKKTADVFASADLGNPQQLFQKGLSSSVINFTSNRMVAVLRPGLDDITSDNLLNFLLDPNIKIGTSTPLSDPSGDYAWQIFDKADKVRPGSSQTLKDKALQLVGGNPSAPPVPSNQNNLVYFLKTNPLADIFLAYYTSGKTAQELETGQDLRVVELPDYLATKADYGLTIIKNADPDAKKLAAYILSPKGQAILANYGFSSPSSTPVPENQGVYGTLLALSVAFAMHRKLSLSEKQIVKVSNY